MSTPLYSTKLTGENAGAELVAAVENLVGQIERCRAAIVTAIDEGRNSMELANHLALLAEAEGQQATIAEAAHLVRCGASSAQVLEQALMNLRLDDKWSGRCNDTRRGFFDGRLEAVHELQSAIIRGGGWTVPS